MEASIFKKEINAELVATFVLMVFSGFYLYLSRGFSEMVNIVFLWMFPASLMVFLTLTIIKIIERLNDRRMSKARYVDWRRK